MKRLSIVLALVVVLGFGQSSWARDYDYAYVSRNWEEPDTTLRTYLRFTVNETEHGPGGTTTVSKVIRVYVTVKLLEDAPLRVGERELFAIEGSAMKADARGYHSVYIRVKPIQYYYDYPTASGTVGVFAPGSSYVTAELSHEGEAEVGAPAAVADAAVDYTTPDEPVTLSFGDFAYEENGSAETTYKFAVYRAKLFGEDKLVAQGEFPHVEADVQQVVIEKDGPFTEGADQWFKNNCKYRVYVWFKRLGTEWYTDDFGFRFRGEFTWSNPDDKPQSLPLEVLTHSSLQEEAEKNSRFEELHGH